MRAAATASSISLREILFSYTVAAWLSRFVIANFFNFLHVSQNGARCTRLIMMVSSEGRMKTSFFIFVIVGVIQYTVHTLRPTVTRNFVHEYEYQ